MEGSTEYLLARLANLKRRRDEAWEARIDTVKQGSLGFTPHVNREIERGLGITELDEGIAALEQVLSDRSVALD